MENAMKEYETLVNGKIVKAKRYYLVKAKYSGEGDLGIETVYCAGEPKNKYTEHGLEKYYESYEIAYRVALNIREELGLKGFTGNEASLRAELAEQYNALYRYW